MSTLAPVHVGVMDVIFFANISAGVAMELSFFANRWLALCSPKVHLRPLCKVHPIT